MLISYCVFSVLCKYFIIAAFLCHGFIRIVAKNLCVVADTSMCVCFFMAGWWLLIKWVLVHSCVVCFMCIIGAFILCTFYLS